MANREILGYRRENGRVGVRNHVVILPLDDISNAACEAVANNIKGTMALPHAYGRLQFGEDLDCIFRTMIGTGANPNVAAVVVIGIEPAGPTDRRWHRRDRQAGGRLLDRAERRHQHDRHGLAQGQGFRALGDRAAARGMRHLGALGLDQVRRVRHHHRARRPARPSATCTTSCCRKGIYGVLRRDLGNHRRRAHLQGARRDAGSRREVHEAVPGLSGRGHRAVQDIDLSDSQPTKGNIEGGLTTIEEKALGNLEKIGRTSTYIDALEPAEAPAQGRRTLLHGHLVGGGRVRHLMAAAGYVVHTFPTGQGNVVGNPIVPVIKISAIRAPCAPCRSISMSMSPASCAAT